MKLYTNINSYTRHKKTHKYNPLFLLQTRKYTLGKKNLGTSKTRVAVKTQKRNVANVITRNRSVATRKAISNSKFRMLIPMSGSRKCGGCGYH